MSVVPNREESPTREHLEFLGADTAFRNVKELDSLKLRFWYETVRYEIHPRCLFIFA